MKIGQYDVSNTSGSAKQRAAIRVKLNGVLFAEVISTHSNPLKYARTRPQSTERKELVYQLKLNAVPQQDIDLILALPQPEDKEAH
ncbi:MAG: hypothetical protein ACXW1D_00410 [Halobacteriota archaeon]